MLQNFEFADEGHTFFCQVEAPRHAGMPPWWWFHLDDNDRGTRYAPFAASETDTRLSVQTRIMAFYAEMLVIAARPVHQRNQRPAWQKPVRPEATADEPAVVVAPPAAD